MEDIKLKLLRQGISLLKNIERRLNEPPKQVPDTDSNNQKAKQEPTPVPFLVSDRPQVSIDPELLKQWQISQEQEDGYKRKSLFWQMIAAIATTAAFAAAAVYAAIAEQTLKATVVSFRTDERAWVEIDQRRTSILPVPAPAKEPLDMIMIHKIWLKNVGKTAALSLSVKVLVGTQLRWDDQTKKWLIKGFQDRILLGREMLTNKETHIETFENLPTTLAPQTGTTEPCEIPTGRPYTLQPAHDVAQRLYPYLIGRIDYMDAFTVRHWKTFCLIVTDNAGDLQYCEYGNDEDQNVETAK